MTYVERLKPDHGSTSALANTAQHLARYLFAASFAAGKHVVDVGTGDGYGAAVLSCEAKSTRAVDLDESTIEVARQRWRDTEIRFMVDDAMSLVHLVRPVDLVVSCENIEHLEDPSRFVTAAARLLDDGGLLICSTPDRASTEPFRNNRPANPFHVNEWYEHEFRGVLDLGFHDITMMKQVRSHSVDARARAMQAVQDNLAYLWSGALFRLERGLRTVLGRRPRWADVSGLAATTAHDFPIVPARWAPLLGTPIAHVALCRRPRVFHP